MQVDLAIPSSTLANAVQRLNHRLGLTFLVSSGLVVIPSLAVTPLAVASLAVAPLAFATLAIWNRAGNRSWRWRHRAGNRSWRWGNRRWRWRHRARSRNRDRTVTSLSVTALVVTSLTVTAFAVRTLTRAALGFTLATRAFAGASFAARSLTRAPFRIAGDIAVAARFVAIISAAVVGGVVGPKIALAARSFATRAFAAATVVSRRATR